MREEEVIKILKEDLNFSDSAIVKLKLFSESVIKANQKHNFISKNTESDIWERHILDSAQLINFIDTKKGGIVSDLGSGAGLPGLIIAIFNENNLFHVKLYEKSPIKRDFLTKVIKDLKINAEVLNNVYEKEIISNYIVCRAFKKIDKIIEISREIIKKPHKVIILKGKNAQKEINAVSLTENYSYRLENSITNNDSKIIVINAK